MKKLTLLAFATTLVFASTAAAAQHGGHRGGGHRGGHGAGFGSSSSSSSSGSSSSSSSSSSSFQSSRSNTNIMVRHGGGHGFRPGHHPGPGFRHHRLQRGFFVHPFWFGPQFHVQNWQLYGFARPPQDHRWLRFYDDAYLVDRSGRVRDHRYDFDWDRYGERWERRDGIPYRHDGDDWAEDEEYYGEEMDYVDRAPLPSAPVCHPGSQPCAVPAHPYPGYGQGYGYGHGYGYGYGVMYPPIIIETTVTTSGCCAPTVEEVVETRVSKPRRHRARPARPRPPPGERG